MIVDAGNDLSDLGRLMGADAIVSQTYLKQMIELMEHAKEHAPDPSPTPPDGAA